MIRWLAAALAALFLAATPVGAQTVNQSGVVSPGHAGCWVTSGLLKDGGSPSNFQCNALGLYNGANSPFAISSQTASGALPASYCTLTLGATTTASLLTANNQSGAGCPLTMTFGGTTVPIGGSNWLGTNFDNQFCSVQGSILFRNLSNWVCLAPGTSGQVLQTLGPAANPQWAPGGGTGSVTSVATGPGLTGGPITSSGTISLVNPVTVATGGTGVQTLAAHAVVLGNGTGAVNLAAPGAAGTCLQSNGAAADPTFQSCPGTGTVTNVATGTGLTGGPITVSGTLSLASPPNGQLGGVQSPGGRLTLQTGTPVMTASQTAVATVYYDAYMNDQVPVWSGTAWSYFTVTAGEISLALDSNAGHTGFQSSGNLFDLFIGNNSGITLCTGPAWTSTTSRGSGAGTTQLSRLNGILTNAVSMTCRFGNAAGNTFTCGVNSCTYVGTMLATANGQTSWTLGASASGGTAGVLALYNYWNRVDTATSVTDSGVSYAYTTATIRQARASAGNQIQFVWGSQDDTPNASYQAESGAIATAAATLICVGYDSTTACSGQRGFMVNTAGAGGTLDASANTSFSPIQPLGVHTISANERGDGTNANVFDTSATNLLTFRGRM